jgi:hypothetical protein
MNYVDKMRDMIMNQQRAQFEAASKCELGLAYLQFFQSEPGLHPDDYLSGDGGFQGWTVLLIDTVNSRMPDAPDSFTYPYWLSDVHSASIENLEAFHSDDEDDEMAGFVAAVREFLDNMDVTAISEANTAISELIDYHDGAPDEYIEPLRAMSECLIWLEQWA